MKDKTHRYIKIDPKTKTITEQFVTGEGDAGTLLTERFRKDIDCYMLECVALPEGDLWIDEEGLLKNPNDNEPVPLWFLMDGEEVITVLSGVACLCRAENGEDGIDTVGLRPGVTVADVAERVRWIEESKRCAAEAFVEEMLGMTTVCFSMDEFEALNHQKKKLMAKAKEVLL